MKRTRFSHNKPDFLVVLVALVALGVLVSATLQAHVTGTAESAAMVVQLQKGGGMALQSH